jgi:hypothetical protein
MQCRWPASQWGLPSRDAHDQASDRRELHSPETPPTKYRVTKRAPRKPRQSPSPLLRRLPLPLHGRALVLVCPYRRWLRIPSALRLILQLRWRLRRDLPATFRTSRSRGRLEQRPQVALEIVWQLQQVTLRHSLVQPEVRAAASAIHAVLAASGRTILSR